MSTEKPSAASRHQAARVRAQNPRAVAPESLKEPVTATEKQAAQMRRMAGVRTVAEAEAAADRAATKRRTYIETGDHRQGEKRREKTTTEKQADEILAGP